MTHPILRGGSYRRGPGRRIHPRLVERKTPTVSELVRIAVEVCDPDDRDPDLGRLEEQLEDDDEPITAVENLEERLAIAAEGRTTRSRIRRCRSRPPSSSISRAGEGTPTTIGTQAS